MIERDLVIGLDCSTTAVKAVVYNAQGTIQSISRVGLPVHKPRPSWHEQPAQAWWQSTVQALREAASRVDPRRVAAICIAPQRETFVLTDDQGNPLHEALLWMDERCRDLLPKIDRVYGKSRIHAETGKPLSANLTLGKLLWLNIYMPELNQASTRVNDVHAFLARRLTGRFVTSSGCADPSGLFDMQNNCWNKALIEATGFNERQFPEVVEPGAVIGELLAQAAQECGLPAHIPLVGGLGDGQSAGLGVG
ncbi:MAG: FGGY-family carbohydrate kinase, partial [Anaerolineaceae bacterium]|nr:FGGY-family carbohydrate kinase [Anaerolineaceae bacterium]